ncbi:hypothetical protein OAF09_02110, partial [bacterium]|nr:hypothetical protein [bacterium]
LSGVFHAIDCLRVRRVLQRYPRSTAYLFSSELREVNEESSIPSRPKCNLRWQFRGGIRGGAGPRYTGTWRRVEKP